MVVSLCCQSAGAALASFCPVKIRVRLETSSLNPWAFVMTQCGRKSGCLFVKVSDGRRRSLLGEREGDVCLTHLIWGVSEPEKVLAECWTCKERSR